MNIKPRVFIDGREMTTQVKCPIIGAPAADVLVVCGQGVYADGKYYGEFHDRDVYFDHALTFPAIAERYKYNVIVTSGGFTQDRAPWLSEAESFLRMLNDAQFSMPAAPIVLDEAALDSAENLLLGLMTARLVLGSIPIHRVGIWAAWQFKKWRFNRNAEALGIVENTYFHGFSPATATNYQVPPVDARQRTRSEYLDDVIEYGLLREPDKENKRQKRWQNNRFDPARDKSINSIPDKTSNQWSCSVRGDTTPMMLFDKKICSKYENRLSMFQCFTHTWEDIGKVANGKSPKDTDLAKSFANEVMYHS